MVSNQKWRPDLSCIRGCGFKFSNYFVKFLVSTLRDEWFWIFEETWSLLHKRLWWPEHRGTTCLWRTYQSCVDNSIWKSLIQISKIWHNFFQCILTRLEMVSKFTHWQFVENKKQILKKNQMTNFDWIWKTNDKKIQTTWLRVSLCSPRTWFHKRWCTWHTW